MVTALMAEISVETAMVTANWWKNKPGDAADERARHEHGAQHQRHRDDGTGDFIHRLDGGGAGVEAGRHVPFDVFQHDDGVVHDDADGQHQAEQRDVVEAEAEGGHDRESADDGDGHVDQRQDHGPPILEENQHHEADQRHRFAATS